VGIVVDPNAAGRDFFSQSSQQKGCFSIQRRAGDGGREMAQKARSHLRIKDDRCLLRFDPTPAETTQGALRRFFPDGRG
jgi:hypothetical protein